MSYSTCGKATHSSRKHARDLLKHLGDDKLSAYFCKVCGGWHLGHVLKKKMPRPRPKFVDLKLELLELED